MYSDGSDTPDHLRIMRVVGTELEGSKYAGFVYGSAAKSRRGSHRRLASELGAPGCVVLVAQPFDVDVFVGWLGAVPAQNRIVYAYTKAAYRASPEQRAGAERHDDAFRIASTLAIAAGISFEREVLCSHWSRAAAAIATKPGNPYSLRHSEER